MILEHAHASVRSKKDWMKIIVYLNKEYDTVTEITKITDSQYEKFKKENSIERFNSTWTKRKVIMFDTDNEDIPKDIFNKMLDLLVGLKQVQLRKVLEKIVIIESELNDLNKVFDGIEVSIKEVLKDD